VSRSAEHDGEQVLGWTHLRLRKWRTRRHVEPHR
jgi:hypothetical protein